MKSILIIDDDPGFLEICSDVLASAGYNVFTAASSTDGFAVLMEEPIDLIICDLHMPFMSGPDKEDYKYSYEVGVRTIREINWAIPHVPIMALTATAPEDLPELCRFLDPIPVFSKPSSPRIIVEIVQHILAEEQVVHVQ